MARKVKLLAARIIIPLRRTSEAEVHFLCVRDADGLTSQRWQRGDEGANALSHLQNTSGALTAQVLKMELNYFNNKVS